AYWRSRWNPESHAWCGFAPSACALARWQAGANEAGRKVADADGRRARRLTRGTEGIVSPDGPSVAGKREGRSPATPCVFRRHPVFWPLLLSVRAGAFAAGGRPADGLPLIDEAIHMTGEANVLYPEFALLKGDLLLAVADPDSAEHWFQSVFDVAGDLGVRLPKLRAATRLTRLRRATGKRPRGPDLLRGVYQT